MQKATQAAAATQRQGKRTDRALALFFQGRAHTVSKVLWRLEVEGIRFHFRLERLLLGQRLAASRALADMLFVLKAHGRVEFPIQVAVHHGLRVVAVHIRPPRAGV